MKITDKIDEYLGEAEKSKTFDLHGEKAASAAAELGINMSKKAKGAKKATTDVGYVPQKKAFRVTVYYSDKEEPDVVMVPEKTVKKKIGMK